MNTLSLQASVDKQRQISHDLAQKLRQVHEEPRTLLFLRSFWTSVKRKLDGYTGMRWKDSSMQNLLYLLSHYFSDHVFDYVTLDQKEYSVIIYDAWRYGEHREHTAVCIVNKGEQVDLYVGNTKKIERGCEGDIIQETNHISFLDMRVLAELNNRLDNAVLYNYQ